MRMIINGSWKHWNRKNRKFKEIYMIPETKLIAVENALQVTFGVNEFEEIRMLTTGLTSALVFRIVVQGNPY
jgi:hypothetical protein